ncbi:hypothetical protein [Acidocella sp. KAb 2-4]|uniref:hypothetical protein n=1 Tax=Acidocella sp. KAb 2-4 TaxID=2885158 RepID=UPI001D068B4F|nr:hypothetical protein [Acidocella sp. KAb 2-4]MCB5943674.1 hypothetical protein [Acidocella sp. KAb 2-4]
MQNLINDFGSGIFYIVQVVMSGIGVIDNGFTTLMQAAGVQSSSLQLIFLLLLMVVAMVLAIRLLGGASGWVLLLLCILLLLHRVLPGAGGPSGFPVASPIENALHQ